MDVQGSRDKERRIRLSLSSTDVYTSRALSGNQEARGQTHVGTKTLVEGYGNTWIRNSLDGQSPNRFQYSSCICETSNGVDERERSGIVRKMRGIVTLS